MRGRRTLILITCLVALLTFSSQPARSTIGLAEWQIYTPGGNLILHADGWKESYGDCLKGDELGTAASPAQRENVYVSHLRRWQYYKGYMAGESRQGFFLFNESNKQVSYYANEKALLETISGKGLGQPLSGWLTAMDGWTEAWFPIMVWKPCKKLLSQPSPQSSARELRPLSKEQCQQALSKATLLLYRETTWGRECQRFRAAPRREQQQQPDIQSFCDEILSIR